MDSAGEELWRLVFFVKRRPWLMEDPSHLSDGLGITEQGDTPLHRLCAWHTNLEQLQAFVAATNPTLTQTNQQGVTCLHLAVYRNSYHAGDIIQYLLRLEPSLASTPMKCGSYPLHILCGQSTTIRKDVLMALLQADPSVVTKQDHNGDTPLSLLWKNVQRFRWARHSSSITLHDNTKLNNKQMMISPNQCLEFSLDMIRANLHKQSIHLVHVCSMPRCPPQLIHLILQYSHLLQMDLDATDEHGRNPLHQAARQPPMTLRFTLPFYIPSLLDYLLEALPHQASLKDHSGRIPLHYALLKQHSLETLSPSTLDRLVLSNPDSLLTKDPVSGLYPFALVALPDNHHHDHNLPTTKDDCETDCHMENGDEDVRQLDTILRLLRQYPEAAIYQG